VADPLYPDEGGNPPPGLILRLEGISKRYGATQALSDVSLEIYEGQMLGIMGHNGAGKSTLARVITGITIPDTGTIHLGGAAEAPSHRHTAQVARAQGFRMVFQELSLYPALRVFENVVLAYPALRGRKWSQRCIALAQAQLDLVFPGHGIDPTARVTSLSLSQRQMVEIAVATLDVAPRPRVLFLDEPTASLTDRWSQMLFTYVKGACAAGLACITVSHRLSDIRDNSHDTVILRDGRIVARCPSASLELSDVVAAMGGVTHTDHERPAAQLSAAPAEARVAIRVSGQISRELPDVNLIARRGEIVGLGGLEGHGQQSLIQAIWRRRGRLGRLGNRNLEIAGPVAYVSGDRKVEGIFPLWYVAQNTSISVLGQITSAGIVRVAREKKLFDVWAKRLTIRGQLSEGITSLSGGNQQKVLLARALASDARVILLDDPLRGVDVATKREIYQLIHEEADKGRCFLWFSTENEGLLECDRIYMMRSGRVVDELEGSTATDDELIAASIENDDRFQVA
jgi:ribose transport system ATP-binding protein